MKFNRTILLACIIIAIVMPVFFKLKFYLTGGYAPAHNFVMGCIYAFSNGVAIFAVNIKTYNWLRKKHLKTKKLFQRLSILFIVTNINAAIIGCLLVLFFYFILNHFGNQPLNVILFNNTVVGIVINSFAVIVIESYYYFKQWKISLVQTEQLKKENILSQFEALKNQIDPHYLFNSLNTIYSLIDTDPGKAKEFITKFSKTYRHVLDVKEKIVVSLKDEIEFLNSYIFLQEIRYKGNLEILISIDAQKLFKYIPPLSLQMLVENAIKHNIISEKKPLKIEIFIKNNSLIVKNNLQSKDATKESTKIGLNNLTERYRHISKILPEFFIKDNEYVAVLPLLNDE